jgi:hypothetical protein
MNPQDIHAGKCYAAKSKTNGEDQHRRVVCIEDNVIVYESWGSGVQNHTGHLSRHKVALDKFANDIYKEIECPKGMRNLSDVQIEAKCGCSKNESLDK